MKRFLASWFILSLVVCVLSVAHAEGINLAFKYKRGEVSSYKMVTYMSIGLPSAVRPSLKMNMSADMTEKVITTYKDGSAKLLITLKNMKAVSAAIANGKSNTIQDKRAIIVVSKYGRVISSSEDSSGLIDPASGSVNPMATSAQSVTFPGKAIAVGESWKNVVAVPGVGSKVYMNNTLLTNSASFKGQKTSKIKQSISSRMDMEKVIAASMEGGNSPASNIKGSVNISGSTIYHFSALKGKILSSKGNYKIITNMIMPASGGKQGAATNVKMVSNVTVSITKQ